MLLRQRLLGRGKQTPLAWCQLIFQWSTPFPLPWYARVIRDRVRFRYVSLSSNPSVLLLLNLLLPSPSYTMADET